MRRSPLLIGAFLLLGAVGATPQSRSAAFNKFRNQLKSDFDSFRARIIEHYADFLDGEWHEFEPLWEEESPYTQPKPKKLPDLPREPEPAPAPKAARLPAPTFGKSTPGGVLAAPPKGVGPRQQTTKPKDVAGKSNYELAAQRLPDPGFAFGSFPGQIAAPDPGESGIVGIDLPARKPAQDNYLFDFYGMETYIPKIDFDIARSVTEPSETAAHWKHMAAQKGGVETARQLFGLAQQLGLNGYLTFRLTEAYANQRFKDSDDGARMSAIHYLLTNMGYDTRLTKLEDRFTVMMPFDQKVVYATMSQTIDGRKYTILYPEGYQPQQGKPMRVATCSLPSGTKGKTSDLRLTGLSLPMKAREYSLSNGTLSIKGHVNENLRNVLHRYPQMPIGDYASSWADREMREDIVEQVKEQLKGKSGKEAVNSLMALCHNGFNYSTDQDFHGFEKPYFLEENFIYDRNDCEDRAIFLSYLLWNALGLPCQLIQYPGHESTAVAVNEDVSGYFYDTDGIKYYSADPTYIGSTVGMVMNAFRNASPTVDKQYR